MNKPPILLINTDQLRPDFLGCYGFPCPTSPRIDALAAGGVRATGMACSSPMCTPSRYSLLSGLYPSRHGARTNTHAPHPGTVSLVSAIGQQGYHTAAFGKLHHHPVDSPFGFDEVALHDGTFRERRPYSVYSKWLVENGVDEDDLSEPVDLDTDPQKSRLKNRLHWGRCRLEDRFCESTFLARHVGGAITAYDRAEQPFFYVSFVAPHSPYLPPPPYDAMFDPSAMPLAARESPGQLQRKHPGLALFRDERYFGALPEEVVRGVRAQYSGLLCHLDRCVGEVVDAFRQRFGRESLIVLTSDHGDHLGDHHIMEKALMYEPSVRVPCIFSQPGLLPSGKRLDGCWSQVDLLPTIMGLAGMEVPVSGLDGCDRSAEVRGGGGLSADRVVFAENYQTPCGEYTAMAQRGTHKLVLYCRKDGSEVFWEFYDLAEDPGELENRSGEPRYTVDESFLRAELLAFTARVGAPRPVLQS